MSLTHPIVMLNMKDSICSGRYQKSLNEWKSMTSTLKLNDRSLVFFDDLNTPVAKIDESTVSISCVF